MRNVVIQTMQLKRAMRSASILSNEEKYKLEIIAHNLDLLVSEVKAAKDPANFMRNIFMRITPKTVPAQHMFGSNVRSQVINELAIAHAKLEDGIWVPDEDRIFAKFALSERSLSEAMWNRDTYSGTPISFIEDHGISLPKYELRKSPEDDYNVSLDKRFTSHEKMISSLKKAIGAIEAGDATLTKASASKLIDVLRNSAGYLGGSQSYDLGIVAEKLDRNSSHLRSEVLSAAYSSLARITEHAQLEYREESGIDFDCPFGAYFAITLDAEVRDLISELLEEDMASYPDDYESEKGGNWAKNLEGGRATNTNKRFAVNQACLAISNTQGQHTGLFGDERTHSSVIGLDLSFCGHEQISDDTDFYDRSLALCRIVMTKVQLTSLLQGAMVGLWEKATLTRFVNFGVAEDESLLADEESKRNYSLDKLNNIDDITADLESIASMSSNIRSKAGKEAFLAAIDSLIVKIEATSAQKRIQIDEKVSEIIDSYKDDAVNFVGMLDKKAGHLLSDDTKRSIALLLTDNSDV
ncbi:hypothetical protein OTK49_02345 [Vibrio coralliirubri]|uniref:hypothetical protein n=1 Tax=Vibrio coralliirubri TaxID=1516159 RepID=UPI0022834FED|nr:hypothetical protein [Vibrio coralliirubri]MCY9861356.1 hypothetical protein [Vibrio coralliirubri]